MAGAVLVTLGLLIAALSKSLVGPVTCPFRLVTGLPCPTCGMVRSAGHVLRGEIVAALCTNPLDAVTMLVVAPLALLLFAANRLGGWAVRISLGSGERILVWLVALTLLAANWFYVLTSAG